MRFTTEIRKAYGNEYVKVFAEDDNTLNLIKNLLEQEVSIKRVNLTFNASNDLTVYPKKMYTAKDVQEDIVRCLTNINISAPLIEPKQTSRTLNKLSICPKAQHLLSQALVKKGNNNRNALDDMRLCLELFLKQVLGNDKSLENQLSEIGKYQKNKGKSPEFTNMFGKLIEYYTKYQNAYVKHDDDINLNEVDFIINLTITFIESF